MDTGFAVSLLGRYLQVGSNAVCVAGTKDKRAVTVQQITCQRVCVCFGSFGGRGG